jgi:hypothetical protein
VAPPLKSRVVGSFSGMGCMVPQVLAARGNRSYQEFWAVTDDPWYPGYFTLTSFVVTTCIYRDEPTRVTTFRN